MDLSADAKPLTKVVVGDDDGDDDDDGDCHNTAPPPPVCFAILPAEVLLEIVSRLDAASMCALCLSSKAVSELIQDDYFWEAVCLREGWTEITRPWRSWKDLCFGECRMRCAECHTRTRYFHKLLSRRVCEQCEGLPKYALITACEATERFNVHQALVWKLRHVTIESYTFYLRSDVLDLLPKSLPSRGGQSVGRSSDKGRLQSGEVEDTTSSEEEEEEEREEEEDDNDDDERQGQVPNIDPGLPGTIAGGDNEQQQQDNENEDSDDDKQRSKAAKKMAKKMAKLQQRMKRQGLMPNQSPKDTFDWLETSPTTKAPKPLKKRKGRAAKASASSSAPAKPAKPAQAAAYASAAAHQRKPRRLKKKQWGTSWVAQREKIHAELGIEAITALVLKD